MKWFMMCLLAAGLILPSVVEAEEVATLGQVWRETRPESQQEDVAKVTSPCQKETNVSAALVCIEKELVGVDTTNANARNQILVDIDWFIQSFADHLDEYDHSILVRLKPHLERLIELANKKNLEGITDADRKNLEALAGLLARVVALEKTSEDHEKRIKDLEHAFTLGVRAEFHYTGYAPVVAGLACPLDITFWSGSVGLRGCVGGGVATNDGSGVLVVSGELLARLWQTPVYFIFGYQYLRDLGPTNMAGADWIASQGTFGLLAQPWGDLIGFRVWGGGGECDRRKPVGEDGKSFCAELAGGIALRVP
jgi:hypothetical protein